MKIAFYGAKRYDIQQFDLANQKHHYEIVYFDFPLTLKTAELTLGFDAICAFVNDDLSAPVLKKLFENNIKIIAMRCAGFDNIDLKFAKTLNLTIVNVPAYSPEAVAEHAIALMMALNRKIHKAYQRTRDANFSLEGFVGFNMFGKTVGIIGTGKIGIAIIRILNGFGCHVLAFDPYPSPIAEELGVSYVDLDRLFTQSDIISLHCPLTEINHNLINEQTFRKMKKGVMVINTSRGRLLNAGDAIEALKTGQLGALGMDVYENEKELFFQDKSNEIIQDDIFERLSACHNVIFTGHQAFLTYEALAAIATTSLNNIQMIENDIICPNKILI